MVAGSRFTLWLNTTMMRLMPYLPGAAKIMAKVRAEIRDVSSAIELRDYQKVVRN